MNDVLLSDDLETIGKGAFVSTALTSVEIPEGVTNLADYAFEGCYALENVIMHDGLQTIEEYNYPLKCDKY